MKKKINIHKKEILYAGITLLIGISLGWLFFHDSNKKDRKNHHFEEKTEKNAIWTCAMHPQFKQNKPGLCPICAMDLVPLTSLEAEHKHASPDEIQMSKSALQLANIQTTIVTKDTPKKSISLLGKVKPDERKISKITARFGGRIEKLFLNYTGQYVVKGQKLAVIYSPELITAQKELLETAQLKSINPSYYKASVNKLKLWNLTEEQINDVIKNNEPLLYLDLLSPITGTVTQRFVSPGDYVKEGSELFDVVDLTRIWVMFEAYESDLPWIKKGDHIEFTIPSLPGKSYKGKVTYIDPFIDTNTRIAQIRIELLNTQHELKPEMFAKGILHSRIAKKANELLIPKSAVLWTGKRAIVYVKVPDRKVPSFLYREITLGPKAGNFYIVEKGLSEKEEIVTNGVFKIDAAAQLSGKPSMMYPDGGKTLTRHNTNHVDNKKKHEDQQKKRNMKNETFKVSGNCEMCKNTIEKAASTLPGVISVNWDIDSEILNISFDDKKSSLSAIHKAIAKSGYDTEKEKAPKEVYDNLPACCQYTRK